MTSADTRTDEDHAWEWCDGTLRFASGMADLDFRRGKQGSHAELRWPHICAEYDKLRYASLVPPRWATHEVISQFMQRMDEEAKS